MHYIRALWLYFSDKEAFGGLLLSPPCDDGDVMVAAVGSNSSTRDFVTYLIKYLQGSHIENLRTCFYLHFVNVCSYYIVILLCLNVLFGMNNYIQVADDENEEPIELPIEEDGTLPLTTLVAQFAGACGLKYRNPETNGWRGIRLLDGRLYAPDTLWGNYTYVAVYPKGELIFNFSKLNLLF